MSSTAPLAPAVAAQCVAMGHPRVHASRQNTLRLEVSALAVGASSAEAEAGSQFCRTARMASV
jgi:hypothetical protein